VKRVEPAFWDASAIVPLCIWQPPSSEMRPIVRTYGRVVVWWGTPIEVRSALARLVRTGQVSPEGKVAAQERLERLRGMWSEILPTERVRTLAQTLPDVYTLTAADSLQLAAALIWCGERPRSRPFVVLDARLASAAARAGFTVIGSSSV
jgi:predicted nucleic acid-binding protein